MDSERRKRIFKMVRDARVLSDATLESLRGEIKTRDAAGEEFRVEELMVELGMLSKYQVQAFMANETYYQVRAEDKYYGRIAVKNRMVDAGDLERYRKQQKRVFLKEDRVVRLSHMFLQNGLLTPAENAAILKAIYKLKPQFSLVRSFVEEAARLAGSSLPKHRKSPPCEDLPVSK